MQRIIMVVVALAAVGIVSAFLSSQLVPRDQAGAAPPPPQPQQVSITSPVDGQGNVRVSGTTNPPVGRLIPLATNVTIPPSGTFTSSIVDTADCQSLVSMVKLSSGLIFTFVLVSPDGVALLPGDQQSPSVPPPGVAYVAFTSHAFTGAPVAPLVAPKAAVVVREQSGNVQAIVDSVSLFCSR